MSARAGGREETCGRSGNAHAARIGMKDQSCMRGELERKGDRGDEIAMERDESVRTAETGSGRMLGKLSSVCERGWG